MRSFSPIGARRAALGAFAIVAFLITVRFGISYGAGALAWLTAVMTGTLACLGVLRAGNPRWMYVSRPRYGTRSPVSVRYRFSTQSSRMRGRSRGGPSSVDAWWAARSAPRRAPRISTRADRCAHRRSQSATIDSEIGGYSAVRKSAASDRLSTATFSGRYWARTSDPQLVDSGRPFALVRSGSLSPHNYTVPAAERTATERERTPSVAIVATATNAFTRRLAL
jgi:hypothetical protein